MPRMLGDVLAEMIRYGDIHEAPIPQEWLDAAPDAWTELQKDEELFTRVSIAATLHKLAHNTQGGSCSVEDELVKASLQQLIND